MLRDAAEDSPAIETLQGALNSCAAQFGSFHPHTIAAAHKLALALWSAGNVNQAVGVLDRALKGLASSSESEHPVRADLLCTLAEIMLEQEHWAPATFVYREALDLRIRHLGANHESSLATKGDLAAVLFQVGDATEAAQLEREATEGALVHLGSTHPVSCVLAWNRAQRYEDRGDWDSARAIVAKDLLWLLAEDDARLAEDQKTIRTLLAERLGWDAARVC